MVRRVLLLGALVLGACDSVDSILEGDAESGAYLRVSWPAVEQRVSPGEELTLVVPVTRLDGYDRQVSLVVEQLPAGVTHLQTETAAGVQIDYTITISVSPTVALGDYDFTLRVRGDRLKDATRAYVLKVVAPPSFTVGVSPPLVRVIRGGIAPFAVTLTRDGFTAPVTVAAEAGTGISASFVTNPVTASQTAAQVAIAGDVTPGTYPLTIRASAGVEHERTATLSIIVLPDDVQLIADSTIVIRQGRSSQHVMILNVRPGTGTPVLAAEGLPSGVDAEFTQLSAHEVAMTLTAHPLVATADYPVTIRAQTPGAADATADLALTVQQSTYTVDLRPDSVSLFQGTRAPILLSLERTALDTTVALSVEGVPAGLTVTASPALVSGTGSTLDVVADEGLTPGTYEFTVAALPSGWPADVTTRLTVRVSIRAAPAGSGNVILHWTGCSVPAWVAVQDGADAWTRVQPVNGAARVAITAGRGAVAQLESDTVVTVRFLSQEEFSDFPEDMCPPPVYSRQVTGEGVFETAGERHFYGYGGATAVATPPAPAFTLRGVAPGIHDFVAWATGTSTGMRGLVRRDQDLPDGSSLGQVDFTGPETFVPVTGALTVSGNSAGSGPYTGRTYYVTGDQCTIAPLYTIVVNSAPASTTISGVPAARQRPTDLHVLEIESSSAVSVRKWAYGFHTLTNRHADFGSFGAGAWSAVDFAGSYKRLELSGTAISMTFANPIVAEYSGSGRRMALTMSRAYANNSTSPVIVTPDFTGVPGWQNAFAPPAGTEVPWSVSYSGGDSGPWCEPGLRISTRASGTR